jgi:hypothetical protein
VSIGVMSVVLTLAFEIGLGRLVGSSWNRIASDYNLLQGGLMPIGLGVMAMSPWIALRFRRLPPAAHAGFSARPAKEFPRPCPPSPARRRMRVLARQLSTSCRESDETARRAERVTRHACGPHVALMRAVMAPRGAGGSDVR